MEGDTKVFDLTASEIQWETRPGHTEDAFAIKGQVPGPTIRATEGERVRIVVHNHLQDPTSIHWHGVIVPNNMDGVGGLAQPPIPPGQGFAYEPTIPDTPGTFMCHSHTYDLDQISKGLYGAFIIEPKHPRVVYDTEYVTVLSNFPGEYLINGKSFPATQEWDVRKGEKAIVRMVNISPSEAHPMHMPGHFMHVIAQDGSPVGTAGARTENTIGIMSGQTVDAVVTWDDPGIWLFHCHSLNHVMGVDMKSPDPMKANGGLVILIKYVEPGAASSVAPSSASPAPTSTATANVASCSASSTAAASAAAQSGGLAIEEVTTDNKFSQPSLTVKAGQPVTMTLKNNGQAIHNWHLLNVSDAEGKAIATALTNPGTSTSVSFTLNKPGTYRFQCDVHPDEMTGTLSVQ